MKKGILLLGLVNLLWGLIPLPATALFETYSVFTVVFSRFLITGLALSVITLLLARARKIPLRKLGAYLSHENPRFFDRKQWIYLLLIAVVGMNGNVLLFFWGINSIGTIVTSMGFIIALVFITGINWGLRKEEFSSFKVLYMGVLILSLTVLAWVSSNQNRVSTNVNFTLSALIVVLGYGFTLALFVVTSDTDVLTEKEVEWTKNYPRYENVRSFFKLSVIMLLSAGSMVPLLAIFGTISSQADFLNETSAFFGELVAGEWWNLAWTSKGIALNVGCTFVPYIIFYWVAQSWKAGDSGTFDLWAGILQILEPIVNIVIGITYLSETFPLDWLGVIITLLSVSIIVKYLAETQAQIRAVLLLKLAEFDPLESEQTYERVVNTLYRIKSVRQIHSLLGEYDLMCEVIAPTKKYLVSIIRKQLENLSRVDKYELLIVTHIESET